jgi:toxin YoeB
VEIAYTEKALEDISYWKKINNQAIQKRITKLIESIQVSPFKGIGKPEPLKYNLTGLWSRRINKEHRLIYEMLNEEIVIYSLKGHYS